MSERKKGFTIVELLIVIVVIAILAAITIVAYNGIQNRSYDSTVKSDLAGSARNTELYKVDNGKYPTSYTNLTALKSAGYKFVASQGAYDTSTNNYAFCYETNGEGYAIVARSKSGKVWYVSSTQATPVEYTQAWTGAVGTTCPNVTTNYTSGQWLYQSSAWSTAIL